LAILLWHPLLPLVVYICFSHAAHLKLVKNDFKDIPVFGIELDFYKNIKSVS